MHALSGVLKIKNGDLSDFTTTHQYVKKSKQPALLKKQIHQNEKYDFKQKLEPFFYNECLYYLNNYGSPNAIILFYLKHGNLSEALNYCLDSTVDEEIFTETIFMKYCTKGDKLDDLLKTMHGLKNSWRVWTVILCNILLIILADEEETYFVCVLCRLSQFYTINHRNFRLFLLFIICTLH